MAISVSPTTDVIYVPKADLTLIQASPEVRELDVDWFRLQLKDWEDNEANIYRPRTHNHNTEVSLAGLTYARTVEVLSPYTVEFEDGQYTVNCVGANHNVSDVKVANQVSLIVNNAAGLINNAQIEYASFNGGVTVDENNVSGKATSGTLFPTGTPQQPVDNWTDALLIDNLRGFDHFFVEGDTTITGSIDLTDKELHGQSPNRTTITIQSLVNTSGAVFHNATVTGTLDGENHIADCVVNDLVYVNGKVLNCGLIGDITLAGNMDATLNDCYTVEQDDPPVIDMGGTGQSLSMPNYSGLLTIKNLSDASSEVGIGVNHGGVVLDSTITAGNIIVAGVGTITDNSTGTAYVNIDALISKDLMVTAIQEAYNGAIYVDTVNGSSGTAAPIGTYKYPIDNLPDALTVAARESINNIHIDGSLTINGENIEGYTFYADRSLGNTVTITSMVNAGVCYFQDLTVSGALTGGTRFTTCVLGALTGFDGGAKNCLFTGDIAITGSGANYFTDCDTYFTGSNYIEISIGANFLNIIRCRGGFNLTDYTGVAAVTADFASANVLIDPTCVSGIIILSGLVSLTDNSGPGCYVIDGTVTERGVATKVWDRELADHTGAGTFGHELATKADIKASASTKYYGNDSTSVVYGSTAAGSDANIDVRDGSYWQVQENATNGLTVEFTFSIGDDDRAGQFSVFGRYEGVPSGSHYMDLWGYNYEAAAWELLVEQFMPGGNTSDDEYMHEYFERNIDRSNNNEVKIRLIHSVATYNASHNLYLDVAVLSAVDVITAEEIATAVWADTTALTLLSDMAFVKNIEGGKWEIVNNEMIFYMPDNITEVARFTLAYDVNLNPVSRTRV